MTNDTNLLLYRESDQYYFCDKYQNPTTREEYAPIIRYAEVLLNEAEAAARQGDKDLALKKLNEVRDRSWRILPAKRIRQMTSPTRRP